MAEIDDIKNVLLNTYMHNLHLSKRLIKRFDPKRVLTLSEFMKLNPFLLYESDGFVGPGKEEYYFFHKQTLLWKELKKFLLDFGFTSTDWAMLIPDEKINRRKNLSFLNKEQLLSLPVSIISPGSSTSHKMFNINVADLLQMEFARYDKQTAAIQNLLKQYGFSEEDGPFMRIIKNDRGNARMLKKKKDICIRSTYANYSLCV